MLWGAPTLAFADAPTPDEDAENPSVTELHQQALSLQEEGDWKKASRLWTQALNAQPASVDILFNLGVAHAHAGDLGHARLYLERASILSPGDRQIERNLKKVQNLVRLDQVEAARGTHAPTTRVDTTTEGLFWWSLLTQSTPNALAIALFIFAWLLLMAQIARRFVHSTATRAPLRVASWIFALGLLFAALIWVARAQIVSNIRPAVIMNDGILLRDGPSPHAGLIELDTMVVPGVLVPTSAVSGDWVKLDFTADATAWTRVGDIEYVAPR